MGPAPYPNDAVLFSNIIKGRYYVYIINHWHHYPRFVVDGYYLLPQFRLADPYSLDYRSYFPHNLATAKCI